MQNETEGLKELVHAFEKSVHQKDVVITNLTDAVQKQVRRIFTRMFVRISSHRIDFSQVA